MILLVLFFGGKKWIGAYIYAFFVQWPRLEPLRNILQRGPLRLVIAIFLCCTAADIGHCHIYQPYIYIFPKKNPYTLHLDLITQAANSVFVAFFYFLIGAFISDVKKVNYHELRTISDDLDWV